MTALIDHDAHFGARREAPANIEAEQALLGAVLINNAARSKVPNTFASSHFFEPFHREVFEAFDRGIKAGRSVNPVTIRSFMTQSFVDQMIGTMTVSRYLAKLVSEASPIGMVQQYAEAITDFHYKRVAISVGEGAETAGFNSKDELEFVERISGLRDRLSEILFEISARNDPEESFFDMVDASLDQTASAASGSGLIGINPGIPEIMQLTGPWQPGKLIVIGGDVKTGKSAAAWQCAFSMAEKHAVGGYSGEMPVEQLIMREKARRTGISAKRQRLGQVSSREMDDLVKAGADMKRLHKVDITAKPMTIEDIDQRIERLQGEYGIEAFVVDHILKLVWTGKMEDADDFKKANKATSTLKNIAMKRNICLVALTHINKGSNFEPYGKSFNDKLNSAMRRRPTYKSMLGNVDKDVDDMIIVHQAYPAVAALEPEPETPEYTAWEQALERVKGRAEFILALSRENEFPRRKDIQWNGPSTSFGPEFKDAQNERLF